MTTLRQLGDTNLELSPIGLGTWQLGGTTGPIGEFWYPVSDAVAVEIVDTALNNGINWFDTAEAYGDGKSEQQLSNALNQLNVDSEKIHIADKWWPKQRTAQSLLNTIEQRKQYLQGYPISLYQIHWPESQSWLRTEMKALAKLVHEGHVRTVGLCNYSSKLLRKAHRNLRKQGISLASVQVRYNLLRRDIEYNDILTTAQDLGISVIAWSPLEQGLLSGRFHRDEHAISNLTESRKNMMEISQQKLSSTQRLVDQLEAIAQRHKCLPAQIALAWLLQVHGDIILAIPGASSAAQAHENAESMNIQLSCDEIEALSECTSS